MKSYEFITESINDKGILKAVFFGGIPGAGKTFMIDKVTSGGVGARVVSTDNILEYLAKQANLDLGSMENQYSILNQSKYLNVQQLTNYVNGLLPLFIDSTSTDVSNTLRRIGILESFGYDVSFIWIDTDLNTALARAKARQRKVDEDFIIRTNLRIEENKKYFESKFHHFQTIKNNDGELDNQAIQKAFNATSSFFLSPLENPIGNRLIETMRKNGDAYLVPNIYSKSDISNILQIWYRSVQ